MAKENSNNRTNGTQSENLRDSKMMAHLIDSLKAGEDVGHYGRLVFVMVARFFMEDREIIKLLMKNISEEEATALLMQVKARDYNPPKRERILEWQKEQDFQICPDDDDPQGCNVYRDLRFPDELYESIEEFWVEKTDE